MEIEFHSEKQLEDYLFWRMELGHCPISEEPVDAVYRQVEMGGYGIVDLVSVKYEVTDQETGQVVVPDTIRIYELKKGALDLDAVAQIARYKRAIDRFMDSMDSWLRTCEVEYYLVGNGYSLSSDVCYLADSIDWLRVCHFKLHISTGIDFSISHGWYSKKEEFTKISSFVESLLESKPVLIPDAKSQEAA